MRQSERARATANSRRRRRPEDRVQGFPGKLDKELVALANASGGRILVGITDGRKIKGAKISNRLKFQVQDAANSCDPLVEIEMESFRRTHPANDIVNGIVKVVVTMRYGHFVGERLH